MNPPFIMIRRSFFAIDGGQFFPGYTPGTVWNGWAMPFFTKEDADRMCVKPTDPKNPGGPVMEYLPDQDAYQCLDDGEGEREMFKGINCLLNEKPVKLYPIGAGSWIWDEVALLCPHCKKASYPHDQGIVITPYSSGQMPRAVIGICPYCKMETSLTVI